MNTIHDGNCWPGDVAGSAAHLCRQLPGVAGFTFSYRVSKGVSHGVSYRVSCRVSYDVSYRVSHGVIYKVSCKLSYKVSYRVSYRVKYSVSYSVSSEQSVRCLWQQYALECRFQKLAALMMFAVQILS